VYATPSFYIVFCLCLHLLENPHQRFDHIRATSENGDDQRQLHGGCSASLAQQDKLRVDLHNPGQVDDLGNFFTRDLEIS
jgi:hypothetical protein